MATQTGGVIQDQNLNFHSSVAPVGEKTNAYKAQKNGGFGGRKALNDISNSGRHTALLTSKRSNSKNVISIEEDIGPSKSISSFGGISKPPGKTKAGGRKALGDLTNSAKPHLHQTSKKIQDKKLSAVAKEQISPHTIAEEGFLHNHQECIKAQGKAIDMDYFLKTVGLYNDNSMQLASPWMSSPLSGKLKPESPPQKYLEMEEISELMYEDLSQWKKNGLPPIVTKDIEWKDYDIPNFKLTETPKLPKH